MRASVRGLGRLAPVLIAGLIVVPAGLQAQETRPEARLAEEVPRLIQVKILGMSCPFCAYGVEQKLRKLAGVTELSVALETGVATLTMQKGADVPNERLQKTVKEAGFEAAAIVRSFESEHEDWNPERLPGKTGSGSTSG